ncbi:fatty acid amide hydrolase 1 [Echinococcus multilocularis]|uniref:Fatty acid amide hydrolase 1 n=1 Tax=Echinococcus multilocularis TaxID=6211 RepID=A0A068YAJ8_ECHMU|nr:fatty acid amide hydrolase 1 [Echinococcus multilocularis]
MLFGFQIVHLKVAAVSVGAFSLYLAKKVLWDRYCRRALDVKRSAKIASLLEAKSKFSSYIEHHPIPRDDVDMITRLPLPELIEKLKKQELPPAYVLLAYQHKAFKVDKELNCATEFLYPELTDVNLKGPLAGAPVSLKECFKIKDLDTCLGCSCSIGIPQEDDSVVLKLIRDLGGVPFVRTNVPQTMLSTQCSNPINGVTLNPLKTNRTPHGSSGGEAALVSACGSPLGLGSDLGGSIRLPAAMCGIVGFKPTAGRLSACDLENSAAAKPIAPTWGPICHDVASCQLVIEALFNSPLTRALDPECPPVPFHQIPKDRRLRIGYFLKLEDLVPVPAVRRALLSVRDKLISRGHKLVEWIPPFTGKEYIDIFLCGIFSDGCESIKRRLAHDKLDPCIRLIYQLACMPWYRRWWLQMKLKLTERWDLLALTKAVRGFSGVPDLGTFVQTLKAFRHLVMNSLRASSIDVVLCPVAGFAAALPINPPYASIGMLVFQNLANTLNVPAGCMPSGCFVEDRDIQVLEQAVNGVTIKSAMDEEEANFYTGYGALSSLHKNMLPLQRETEGLPIPIQFMSLPWQDELCLFVMREAELGNQCPSSLLPKLSP